MSVRGADLQPRTPFDRIRVAMLAPHRLSALRTADEATAPDVEAQRTVGRARNADPFAQPDFIGRAAVRSEPQRAGLTEVDPVQPAIDP